MSSKFKTLSSKNHLKGFSIINIEPSLEPDGYYFNTEKAIIHKILITRTFWF